MSRAMADGRRGSTSRFVVNGTQCKSFSKSHAMHFDSRWPHLRKYTPKFAHGVPHHLYAIEPLSVHAFTSAIVSASAQSTAIDIGTNIGAYAIFAALLGVHVVAVDMQPMCMLATSCNLMVNGLMAELHLGYVAPKTVDTIIKVPDDECGVMASPTAVAGRWPTGLLQKKSRVIYGMDNRTHILSPKMRMTDVVPLHLGAYVRVKKLHSISVIKIDTEGYEIAVLEALRPIWAMVNEVILELQPHAWKFANITLDRGLDTLRELMQTQSLAVVTLPHRVDGDDSVAIANWTVCQVKTVVATQNNHHIFAPSKGGTRKSQRFEFEGLRHYVLNTYHRPQQYGWFSEIMLTNRCNN